MEENNIIYLLKFVDKEYADDFENGKLYFNKLEHFHDIENEAIGDSLEGIISNRWKEESKGDITMHSRNMETGEFFSLDVKEVLFKNINEKINKLYINCFTAVRINDLEQIEGNKYRLKKSFQDGLKEIINNRNIYCINFQKFLTTLKNSFSHKGINYKASPIEYFDTLHPLYDLLFDDEMLKDINVLDCAFYKRDEYKRQREYRVAVYDLENPLQSFKGMNEDRILFNDLMQVEFLKGTYEEIIS